MNTFKFVLLALCVAAAKSSGCWSSREFIVQNNWVLGNGVKAAQLFKSLSNFMKGGSVKGVKDDPNAY